MPTIVKPLSTASVTHEKLDPRLAALLELDDSVFAPADPVVNKTAGAARSGNESMALVQRRSGPLAFLSRPPRSLDGQEGTFEASVSRVPVFVTATAAGALDDIARRVGLVGWRSRAGRMATAEVNRGQLLALEQDERVVAVEWTGGAKPQMIAAGVPVGVPPRRALGLAATPSGLDGAGVVVGVVDIEGIDLYHPDFSTEDGCRVQAIWDQNRGSPRGRLGKTPGSYGYGVAYTREDICVELSPNRRVRYRNVAHMPLKMSHGTMVAGVAAGGGVEDESARGVAPAADIVFVSTPASGAGALAAMTEVAEAVDFVLRQAEDRPCVVNVSLGDDLGPHDGTSPVERFFDEVLAERPGRAIVIAAGNAREARTNIAGVLGAGAAGTLFCDAVEPSDRNAVLEIWYDRVPEAEAGIGVQIVSPDGASATPIVAAEGRSEAFDLGMTRIIVASVKRYPGSDDALLRIEMFPRERDGHMDTGAFEIRLSGGTSARACYAWLDHPSFKLRAADPGADAPPSITLTSPGTCKSAITVGACSEGSDAPTEFTGCGPGRRDVDKPDVLACGVMLRAPAAVAIDRTYPVFTGTSGAAPLVTGAIALLFQYALARGARLSARETRAVVRAAAAWRPSGAAAGGETGAAKGRGPHRLLWPDDEHLASVLAAAAVTLQPDNPGSGAPSPLAPAATDAAASKERDTMDQQDIIKTAPEGQDMTREQDGQQIGVGYFVLYQGAIQVGRLLVVNDKRGSTTEHWDLSSTFRQPSWSNVRQDLAFVYQGQPISVEAFKRDIRTGSTYIIAQCQQQTNP